MLDMLWDVLLDTVLDSLKILPFLYLTYLVMEWIGHKSSTKMQKWVESAGKYGPAIGGVLGAFPQCGFSTAAASLYSGKMITLGTLLAIFWSTSDEMLPIMISEQIEISMILKVIGLKVLIGIILGFIVDLIFRKAAPKAKMGRNKKVNGKSTGTLCQNGLCSCKKVIFKASVRHTAITIGFIFLVSLLLNLLVAFVGEEQIAAIVMNKPVLGPILSGIVGLIPNCAASVVITQLYLGGMLSFGTMFTGLLVGAGVGLLILIKEVKDWKEIGKVVGILYGAGVLVGLVLNLLNVSL